MKLDETGLSTLKTDALYSYQLPSKSNFFVKNRYMKHPFYHYDVFGIFMENSIHALCVIRPIFQNNTTILRIVDFIGSNEIISSLKFFIFEVLRYYQAEYIDLYSYGIPSELLQRAGFVDRHKIPNLVVPDYFEPFVRRNVELSFAYKCNNSTAAMVRLFKGDGCDQDRPNILDIQERRGETPILLAKLARTSN